MHDARDMAWMVVQQWTTQTSPPLVPERGDLGEGRGAELWGKLSPRDRAFAFDIVTGVLRWRGLLDAVIGSRLRQPLEQVDLPVRAVMWVGAYQLLLQGGTTAYAAVDTSVALAKKHNVTARAAGLVNAVLRGITRMKPERVAIQKGGVATGGLTRRGFAIDFETMVMFAEDVFPEPSDRTAHLAVVRSHPGLYVGRLRKLFGDEKADALLLRNNVRPVVTLRADAEEIEVPAAAGLVKHATAGRFLVAASGWNEAIEGLVKKGKLSPQDPTAAKPVRRIEQRVAEGAMKKPGRILDLCAGLGTKSVQLARAFPEAQVVAADVDSVKLQRLAMRVKELGIKNVSTQDAGKLEGETFDLVVADVPCSNTGVMGKRVQSRWRWPVLDRAGLAALQKKLLAQGMGLLNDMGTLVYATCSVDAAENGELVRGVEGVRLVEEELSLPWMPQGDGGWSPEAVSDGGYFAVVVRK